MRHAICQSALLLTLSAAWQLAAASSDARLSYAGRLSDAAGAPLSGPLDLEVRLYAAGDAPEPVWTRLVRGVALSAGGVFELELEPPLSGTAAIATSKLSGAVTQVTGHGLGALATLSAVGTAEITDATIANADISGTAAIATSKLSGTVTSISGHGLGSLATMTSVGSAEITDGSVTSTDIANGTIADADISGTAAIATSKLSGAVTSISGNGLGSLATLSAVGSNEITNGSIIDADISGTAAINSSKISFANDGISGDKIDGGTISNFASTGIDDNASALAMTITLLATSVSARPHPPIGSTWVAVT